MQKLESQMETSWKEDSENHKEKTVQTLEAQTENVRNYLVLQRNIIPAHKPAADKWATSDPHDEKAPQKKLRETMDSGWAMRRDAVDENKKTNTSSHLQRSASIQPRTDMEARLEKSISTTDPRSFGARLVLGCIEADIGSKYSCCCICQALQN